MIAERVFALKVMSKQFIVREGKVESVQAERRILDRLLHPGVVRLLFTFQAAAAPPRRPTVRLAWRR